MSFFGFEVIAERPVAHHFEESKVRRVADAFYVYRSYATLNVAKSGFAGRMRFSEKIGHKRLHARHVEHDSGRTVADKRNRAYIFMTAFLVKFNPGTAELFGSNHF